jgi:hypothetical protein
MKMRLIGAALAVLLIGACATVPPSQKDDKVLELVDRFNTVPSGDFVANSGLPFLFGDQVLYAESDLEAVLRRAKEAGLVLTPQIVGSTDVPPRPADARFDVGVYYDELPEDARLVIVESTAGAVSLIVGGEGGRLPLLLGLVRGRP